MGRVAGQLDDQLFNGEILEAYGTLPYFLDIVRVVPGFEPLYNLQHYLLLLL
jgi:hypothetical protein